MALEVQVFAFRSLRAKFLAVVVPFFLLSTVLVFGLSELTARRELSRKLQDKLDEMVAIQSAVLAEPIWNVADEQIELVLAAMAIDRDVLGAVVYDEAGNRIGAIGSTEAMEQQAFFAQMEIIYRSDERQWVIGRLAVALTDTRVQAESQRRLLIAVGLAGALLVAVVAIALVANRRTIGLPLERLLDSIKRSQDSGQRVPVKWASRDEIGKVVSAFNEMQLRQEAYQVKLREARDHLERRVEERTNELAQKSSALEQLSNKLAKYLPPQIYDSIFSGKQEVKLTSSRKKLTVFFSDIAGFTETADRLESEELTALINHYLTEMSRIALHYGATIDKYMGDGIMIFFGDPGTKGVKEDALACVMMAIDMRERMHGLADIWREMGIEKPLRVRMGIHTGYCTVGNFGGDDRMDYTIIGGGANLASRLESAATPGEILISYETFAHVKDKVLCQEQGKIEVKGIAHPLTTYRVVDTYQRLGRKSRHFHEAHPNISLDLDLDTMDRDDRAQAAGILKQALDLLNDGEGPAETEPGRTARRGRR